MSTIRRPRKSFFAGHCPAATIAGDFGADLRALILSLKYCGNMSEPKIGEFLQNFDVQISAGSLSNILTNTAKSFEDEFHDLFTAGLASTPYQQTDDTSARVAGKFWHTHIVCNPYYTAFFTRPHKDRLTVLSVLQNTTSAGISLQRENARIARTSYDSEKMATSRGSLGRGCPVRCPGTAARCSMIGSARAAHRRRELQIEQAAATVYYQQQTTVPVVETLVCDDAGQFKSITDHLALCWIHAGRHYEKLSPVVSRHAVLHRTRSAEKFWDYYAVASVIVLAQPRPKQNDYEWSSTSCFDADRLCMRSMIGSPKRRPRRTNC